MENWGWMIFLVFLVFVIVFYFSSKDNYLESLIPMVHQILSKCNQKEIAHLIIKNQKTLGNLQLRNSKDKTYTANKQKIYLITERSDGKKYNQDTILFVLLHEVAHILSPDEHHTKGFFEIEKKLHRKAIELGVLNISNVERDYPCTQ
jgi:hypothetical protein